MSENTAEHDLERLTEYVLDQELQSFQDAILEGTIRPAEPVEEVWDDVVERYVEQHDSAGPEDEGLLDWLALYSEGHVYCCAARLNLALRSVSS